MTTNTNITVRTADNEITIIDASIVKFFVALKKMIADESHTAVIPLLDVTAPILRRIIAYCEHHIDDTYEEEPKDVPRSRIINDQWDIDFYANDKFDILIQFIHAARYLDVKPLHIMTCKMVAERLNAVANTCVISYEDTCAKFKEALGIESDYTEEEKEKIKRDDAWLWDNRFESV